MGPWAVLKYMYVEGPPSVTYSDENDLKKKFTFKNL